MKRMPYQHLLGAITLLISLLTAIPLANAAADLEINTPAISALQQSMQSRHAQLAGYYASGAIGLTRDGMIAVRDASAVPLSERGRLNSLVADENKDRSALYREIARANGHPEWEGEVRTTFAERWISKAAGGWWYQNASGAWVRK
jgi:uncharacterized protein YdbL (DUF1318 family)